MFGTELVSTILVRVLQPLAVANGNLAGPVAAPLLSQGYQLPAVLMYPEFSSYDGPMMSRQIGGSISSEQLRMVVKAVCKGESTTPILDFCEAQIAFLDGFIVDAEAYRGSTYQVTFTANGEIPITTQIDGGEFYRQLGTVYDVHITRG